jgi:hypothetical protein
LDLVCAVHHHARAVLEVCHVEGLPVNGARKLREVVYVFFALSASKRISK